MFNRFTSKLLQWFESSTAINVHRGLTLFRAIIWLWIIGNNEKSIDNQTVNRFALEVQQLLIITGNCRCFTRCQSVTPSMIWWRNIKFLTTFSGYDVVVVVELLWRHLRPPTNASHRVLSRVSWICGERAWRLPVGCTPCTKRMIVTLHAQDHFITCGTWARPMCGRPIGQQVARHQIPSRSQRHIALGWSADRCRWNAHLSLSGWRGASSLHWVLSSNYQRLQPPTREQPVAAATSQIWSLCCSQCDKRPKQMHAWWWWWRRPPAGRTNDIGIRSLLTSSVDWYRLI
jgi:hypothetical protein